MVFVWAFKSTTGFSLGKPCFRQATGSKPGLSLASCIFKASWSIGVNLGSVWFWGVGLGSGFSGWSRGLAYGRVGLGLVL